MFFVWSWWYLVALVLVAAIVASVVVLFKMDKKDIVLIKEFQEANTVSEEKEETASTSPKADTELTK